MTEATRGSGLRAPFERGFSAALTVLLLWFIARLGGLAPFPPESALVAFLSVIPESIEEPAVQGLGELAGLVGLVVAALIAAVLYGLLGVFYDRYVLRRAGVLGRLSTLERALVYSLVPWLVFGVVVLPLAGGSFFGVASGFASPGVAWAFPLTTLVFQLLWGILLWARMPTPVLNGGSIEAAPRDSGRRTFIERGLVLAGSAVLVLVSLGSALGALTAEGGVLSEGAPSILPGSAINTQDAPAIFGDPRLAPLVNSEMTSNDSFYRVAIDLFDPSVDATAWSLSLSGLVGNPKTYSLSDIQRLPTVTEYDTFLCVSNLINGGLISNAEWGGVRLSDLFADAGGVGLGATYVVFYSVDGYSVSIPLAKALEQTSILAYEMNGVPLPQRHGYPLRAVIPGLYGMMSAKWVRRVELRNSVEFGYWQTRGWSNDATVQTVTFVRIPQDGASVSLSQDDGSVLLGGMAFAGDRGISKVEVSVDGGSRWEEAVLKPPASALTWVLWAFSWRPPAPGKYVVYARATDGGGQLQTSTQADPYPSGATGYVMSTVNVVA